MLLKKLIRHAPPLINVKIRVYQELTALKTLGCYHSFRLLSSDIVEKSDYSEDFSKSDVDFENVKKSIEHLHSISECINDNSWIKYISLFDSITKNIEAVDDDDLHKLLDSLKVIKNNVKNSTFEKEHLEDICAAIDEKCYNNMPNWTFGQSLELVLKFTDIDKTRRYKNSFIHRVTKKFTSRGLYKKDVHLLKKFLILAQKCCLWNTPYIKMYDVVHKIQEEIDNIPLKDTVPFAMAYYSNERFLRDETMVKKWYEKLLNEMDTLTCEELTHILKLFSTYCSPCGAPYAYTFLTKFIDKMDEVDCYCYSFAALLTSHYPVYHPQFLNKLLKRYAEDIENLSFSCTERILHVFSYFNFRTDELCPYQLSIDEFEKESRQSLIMDHTKSFTRIVKHLTFAGVYHTPFVNQVLSVEYLKKSFKKINKHTISPDIFMVDQGVEIECPNYNGNRLDENLVQNLRDKYAWRLNEPNDALRFYFKLLIDINNVLSTLLGGPDYTHMCYPLPHFLKHDIVFCLNDNEPVKLPDVVKQSLVLTKSHIGNNTGKWYCVTALHRNKYFDQPLKVYGSFIVKIRQLQCLGFTVVTLDGPKWMGEMSYDDKVTHLKETIRL